jgi:hypothetical protein
MKCTCTVLLKDILKVNAVHARNWLAEEPTGSIKAALVTSI